MKYYHLLDHCYSRPIHGGQAVEAEVVVPAAGVEVEVTAAGVEVEVTAAEVAVEGVAEVPINNHSHRLLKHVGKAFVPGAES